MIAFRAALAFQDKVGRAAIEQRAVELTTQLVAGLSKLPGVKVWTSPSPELRAAVVSFLPGTLDANKLATALYEKDKIGITTRGGQDRGGMRVSPHFYNSPAEVDRLLAALSGYLEDWCVTSRRAGLLSAAMVLSSGTYRIAMLAVRPS